MSRRRFVRLGAAAVGGVTLADALAGQARAAPRKSTAVIQVFLAGGPSQLETFDPKPGAAAEYRGPLDAIRTSVVGLQISEAFPLLARQMDKFSVVRSVTHGANKSGTAKHLTFTGFSPPTAVTTENERPAVGAVASALRGARVSGVPAYVAIPSIHAFAGGASLNVASEPFELSDPGPAIPTLRTLRPSIALDTDKLSALSKYKISLRGMNRLKQKGLDRLTLDKVSGVASKLASGTTIQNALNVEQETAGTRASYGPTLLGQRLLLARRLVEAGVTFVTVEDPGWAMHSNIEKQMSMKAPALDRAVSARAADLTQRGLYQDVLVVVHGESGRQAQLNKAQGRGNSGSVYSVLLGGGGLRTGRVVGSSDALGESVKDSPVGPEDILATIYSVLGIDPLGTIQTADGQSTRLLLNGTPIKDLV